MLWAELPGFDPELVEQLPKFARVWHAVYGLLTLAGTGLLAASIWLGADEALGTGGVAVALLGAFVLLCLQRLMLAGGGYAAHLPPAALAHWRPKFLPAAIALLWSAALAQPLVVRAMPEGVTAGAVADLEHADAQDELADAVARAAGKGACKNNSTI